MWLENAGNFDGVQMVQFPGWGFRLLTIVTLASGTAFIMVVLLVSIGCFALLIPLRGNLYLKDMPDGALRLLVESGESPLLDPRFSPDSQWVAYVQDAEIYVVPVSGGEPRQITFGARGTGKTHGLAEYIAQHWAILHEYGLIKGEGK